MRSGEPLRIGRQAADYCRNAIAADGANFVAQHRFFVNDPWELLTVAIHRAVQLVFAGDGDVVFADADAAIKGCFGKHPTIVGLDLFV
jgi:hypothetical protein